MAPLVTAVPDMFHYWETQMVQDIVENSYIEVINPQSGYEARSGGDLKFVVNANDTYVGLSKSYIYFKLGLKGGAKKGTAL